LQEIKITENENSFKSSSEKNLNLFFVIASIVLVAITFYLLYAILDKTGVIQFKSEKAELVKPKNVQQLIQVEILNGCGVSGVGDILTDALRSKGIDVVKTGNYRSFDIDKTFIVDRMGKMETAYSVADSLNIDRKFVISEINKNYFLDLTIVIGKDYKNYFNKSGS
jgi:hypothetical protein